MGEDYGKNTTSLKRTFLVYANNSEEGLDYKNVQETIQMTKGLPVLSGFVDVRNLEKKSHI